MARTLAAAWGPGDEVVVTRLDHDANIRPWVQAAAAAGAVGALGRVRPGHRRALRGRTWPSVLSPRTRLVAVTAASNLIGTRPPVRAITDLAHEAGALAYVDGVHLHRARRRSHLDALGADFFACSPYKFLGPHCGVLAARPGPAGDAAAGQAAAVDRRRSRAVRAGHAALRAARRHHRRGRLPGLAGAAPTRPRGAGAAGPGRWARIEAYEDGLRDRIEAGLAELPGMRLLLPGRAPHAHAAARVRRPRPGRRRTRSWPSAG